MSIWLLSFVIIKYHKHTANSTSQNIPDLWVYSDNSRVIHDLSILPRWTLKLWTYSVYHIISLYVSGICNAVHRKWCNFGVVFQNEELTSDIFSHQMRLFALWHSHYRQMKTLTLLTNISDSIKLLTYW